MPRNWRPTPRSGCPGTTAQTLERRLEYDESCLAEKDRLRPWLGDTPKWPPNGPFQRQNRDNVFGQARKPAKMFRAGLYARVSTNDQQTLPDAEPRHAGVCRPAGLDHCRAGP